MPPLDVLGNEVLELRCLAASRAANSEHVSLKVLRCKREEPLQRVLRFGSPILRDSDPLVRQCALCAHEWENERVARRNENEEPDYLALAQLSFDHRSFVERVREAFLLEYGAKFDYEIASILGRDKSRIAQILKNPERIEAQTIRYLVEALKRPKHRREIVDAWIEICFGDSAGTAGDRARLGDVVSEKTVRRIGRMIRQRRLLEASQLSLEALQAPCESVLRMQIEDRAFLSLRRLDEPGKAMMIARLTAEHAIEVGNRRRFATALSMRVRAALHAFEIMKVDDVFDTLAKAAELLEHAEPAPSPPPPFLLVTLGDLAFDRIVASLTFAQRGLLDLSDEVLTQWLDTFIAKARKPGSHRSRSSWLRMASHTALQLGKTFQAQELLEQSYRAGGEGNYFLNRTEMAGLIEGKILSLTNPSEGSEYFAKVAENCAATSDRYHQRIAEWERVRLELSLFPSSPPR